MSEPDEGDRAERCSEDVQHEAPLTGGLRPYQLVPFSPLARAGCSLPGYRVPGVVGGPGERPPARHGPGEGAGRPHGMPGGRRLPGQVRH
jgi:hypothetical protein